jgi:hypothetical protein
MFISDFMKIQLACGILSLDRSYKIYGLDILTMTAIKNNTSPSRMKWWSIVKVGVELTIKLKFGEVFADPKPKPTKYYTHVRAVHYRRVYELNGEQVVKWRGLWIHISRISHTTLVQDR